MAPLAMTRPLWRLSIALWLFTELAFPPVALAQSGASAVADTLVVGIFPRRNARQTVTLFTPLINHLSAELNREVELVTARDFATFWGQVARREFDLVHFNQYHYIKAHAHYGYEAIVANEEFGERSIASALYVRRDSGIESLSQLRGRTLIFGGDKSAMMSYIIPIAMLQKAGLQQGDYQQKFAITPLNSVFSVYFKQADAAAAGEIVARLPMITERIDVSALKQLQISEAIPHLPWAVAPEMPIEQRQQLSRLLTTLSATATGRALLEQAKLTGLHPATDADYERVRHLVKQVLGETY
ncbi:phosphate/phosphite/phosphonate ABC transporter substrate-binding protein [Ectothiorhodospiraceae bacterium BW-2]|nr:phosphate/phosphite/phosphonate ABC transporter substrate-binding protein [Ectothiorhodospiraceae bacterium BW-2]